ncbi:MAG TPA: hypothetical protein VG676_07185 [Chitinophagaceae bacterium]|jgi:hypothetical protein|nr:hypothetical protein [Chitinophagaceae bacterium]
MKNNFFKICLSLTLCIAIASCKKDGISGYPAPSDNGRTIRFQLYTDQDFSNDNHIINFSVFIKKGSVYVFDTTASNILYDSTFAPIQIRDIPDPGHKIVIEKKIVGYDGDDLTAGFVYEIVNVGYSWHIDTSRAGNPLKVIDYNFR